ncbi:MAG: DUF4870 domain-containing protein [Acidobacteriota bacterium]|jgi:uncharacterized Tic20 family protein|nr:DUF4870 domain-containing protein [Acidobacteriota bacterium]
MDYMQQPPPMSLQTPEQKQMGMFLHLSQLLNFLIPFAGVVVPIVLWQTQKDKMPALDAHGKIIANWMISSLIYGAISFILLFVLVGILGFVALGIMAVVFPIIGGIKANNGEFWEYPLTIKFLK